jgi:hypothetical protein
MTLNLSACLWFSCFCFAHIQLGKFVPLVGGGAHAHNLFQPLEALAAVDETVVREKVRIYDTNILFASMAQLSHAITQAFAQISI